MSDKTLRKDKRTVVCNHMAASKQWLEQDIMIESQTLISHMNHIMPFVNIS